MPTRLLQEAFERASALPEETQDHLAGMLTSEVEQALFDELLESPASLGLLERLAAKALAEERAGLTEPGGFDGR